MYLSKFEAFNLQKHEHIVVEFQNNINVLIGTNRVGKSGIVRGISYLFFNDVNTKSIRKTGTKETRLIGTVIDGEEKFDVERIVGNTSNAYIIRKNGNETRFDAIGRDIPEEVKSILKMTNIEIDKEIINLNIDQQRDQEFLIGTKYSDTFKAKLFNILTGNEVQDKIFKDLNKDLLGINRKEKTEKEEIENLVTKQTSLKEEVLGKEQNYAILNKKFKKIKKKHEVYESYVQIAERFRENNKNIENTKEKLQNIQTIDIERLKKLEEKIEYYEKVKTLSKRYIKNETQKEMVRDELKKIVAPSVDLGQIMTKIETLEKVKSIDKRYKTNIDAIKNIKEQLENVKNSIIGAEKEYEDYIKELDLCDKCPLLRS